MANTFTLIQAQTLASATSSVTFSNIPQNFTDLMIKVSVRDVTTAYNNTNFYVYPNGSASNGFSRYLMATGTAVSSGSESNVEARDINTANNTASTFANVEFYIPNYTSANFKSFNADSVLENNASFCLLGLGAALWSSTSAITSLSFGTFGNSNMVANSTFYLYGIGGTRATGGTITADVNYTYHTFTSSSTFTALEKIKNAEILLVAGGAGAGASPGSGGGGAGGVRSFANQIFTAGTSFTAIVGAGGSGAVNSGAGTNGGNSMFGSFSATGGGRGANNTASASALTGGSGGGGTENLTSGAAGNAGEYSPVEGYAGGNGSNTGPSGGGGGGAGAVGGAGSGTVGGAGGAGAYNWATWLAATNTGVNGFIGGGGGGGYYYTGGVGGFGGVGGGGAGTNYNGTGTAGTANTGGGGGGTGWNGAGAVGGAGGSGLVIIRYPNR